MTSSFPLSRQFFIFLVILPLAIFAGYLMATPDFTSWGVVGLILMTLLLPLFLRWHHVILVMSWNLAMQVFFLPGSPPIWMLVALGSLGISLLGKILDKEKKLLFVPSVSWPLIFLALVVIFTMQSTGSIGLRSLGSSSYGGKKYFYILFTVVAFFALSAQRIPTASARFCTGGYFLSGVAPVLSNAIYFFGPSFWVLYYLFPVSWAAGNAMEDFSDPASVRFGRLPGLAFGGLAVFTLLLARYGLRGILDWTKPWRVLLFVTVIFASLFGGYRSVIVTFFLIAIIQFFLEGLHRSQALPVVLVSGVLVFTGLVFFARQLPLSVQRCLTVLPIEVDPVASIDAAGSTEWRLRMWKVLLPEVSRYFWVGKGYSASAADYYFAMESTRRGLAQDFETSLTAGDYHNGPLSIIIPFGVFGVLGFFVFIGAGLRVLILNYSRGDPALKTINTLLLSCFVARLIFFCFVYGAVDLDIAVFAGLVGLSISLNGGIAKLDATAPSREREKAELGRVVGTMRPHRA